MNLWTVLLIILILMLVSGGGFGVIPGVFGYGGGFILAIVLVVLLVR